MNTAHPILTERFELTTLTPAQATERYASWLSDPEVSAFLETRFESQSVEQLSAYISAMQDSPSSYLFGVFTRSGHEHIGNIKLGPIDARHSRAAIGILIGEQSWWGKGVATEIIAALADWSFAELGLHKLFAGSYARNAASIRAFTTCGFVEEGRQRDHVVTPDGTRDDVVLLGRVNPNGGPSI